MAKSIILIPSRMAATRLPNKPLLKINNKSMIMHVYDKALESNIGDVFVATSDQIIFDEVKSNGGKSIITSDRHNTGTDRIAEALSKIDTSDIDYVINLQGDEPLIDINDIKNLNYQAITQNSDLATLACKIDDHEKYNNPNIVKVMTEDDLSFNDTSKAIKFERKSEYNNENFKYHHIGIYIFKTSILKKFVEFPQSLNEKNYKLEQLRALDNGINIDVILAKSSPVGIDTEEDYLEIKKLMEYKS